MWNERTSALIGQIGIEKLKKSNVCVVGIGGVGGYVCTMLARAGIGKITIVDFDTVDETNINRQVVANIETVGMVKVDVMKEIIGKINPDCDVRVVNDRFSRNLAEELFSEKYDFVVDAIDSVPDKVDLIVYCKENDINIISAMGAGNRKDIPNFVVTDIYKTNHDGLAKVMRKKLREKNVQSLKVVTTFSPAEKNNGNVVGSISYYPAMCGCVIGAYVINELLDMN